MTPSLSVVADDGLARPKAETVAQRVRRLQAEAKALAKDHITTLDKALMEVERIASEIADGGDAYPPGIRDLARRLVEDMETRGQTIAAILARSL